MTLSLEKSGTNLPSFLPKKTSVRWRTLSLSAAVSNTAIASALGCSPLAENARRVVPGGAAAVTSAGAVGGAGADGAANAGAMVSIKIASANREVRIIANSKWEGSEDNPASRMRHRVVSQSPLAAA